jgi:hypothetical protein
MDWEQAASFVIVAATAGAFLRAKWRRRKFSLERDTPCGCGSAPGPRASIVFHARKGQRARIIVKSR